MKREVNIFEHAGKIYDALSQTGILVTTNADDKSNVMTIGWGTLGIEWATPIFTVYVRTGRFSHELIEKNPEFTICAPMKIETAEKKITAACGSKTGRNINKFDEAGLTIVEPELVKTPAIKEFPLTIECRVIFQKLQPIAEIDSKFEKFYPAGVDSTHPRANEDPHTAYYGEILKSYIIE